jgi:hypothetical protein
MSELHPSYDPPCHMAYVTWAMWDLRISHVSFLAHGCSVAMRKPSAARTMPNSDGSVTQRNIACNATGRDMGEMMGREDMCGWARRGRRGRRGR